MKSKKAFLLGEYTLKIIIAVLCILLLVYLLFGIFSNSQGARDLKMAEASLDDLVKEMNKAEETGEAQKALILNPVQDSFIEKTLQEEWWIIAWPYKNEEEKPNQCYGNYCICICAIPENYLSLKALTVVGNSKENSLNKCNSLGVCKDFDEKIKTINPGLIWNWNKPIPIENPPVELEIKYDNKEGFEIKEK